MSRWLAAATRMRRELRDALELVLIPGLAVVLPWRLCFWLFKMLAHWNWLYRQACDADWQQAYLKGMAPNRETWLWQRRLLQIVDHADHYLFRTRSDKWLRRHVHVQGDWRELGEPGFLFTFHWGAGMWGLRHACKAGLKVHALAAPANGAAFEGRWVLRRYAQARLRSVEMVLEQPLILVPKGLRQLRQITKSQDQVLALLDVPQDDKAIGQVLTMLGEQVQLSLAMPEMAGHQQRPVAVYATGMDWDSGQRYLQITVLPPGLSALQLSEAMVRYLEKLICNEPAAWHLWGQWPRFRSLRP